MPNKHIQGLIFDIQRFSIHDGSGIRTLVFMKGCPLRCKWCSNPESQEYVKEVAFFKEKCIGCGKCISKCANNSIDEKTFVPDKKMCIGCGECASICPSNSRRLVGELKNVEDVIDEIEKDRVFYRNSGGGVTIGGGEPLAQPGFVHALLNACKKRNLNTAIETCGFAIWENVKDIFKISDEIFYDLKHMDRKRHKQITGVYNDIILDNAHKAAKLGKPMVFRIPFIPGYNDDFQNILETGEFVKNLMEQNNFIKMELLEYHSLGISKYHALDRAYAVSMGKGEIEKIVDCKDLLRKMGITIV